MCVRVCVCVCVCVCVRVRVPVHTHTCTGALTDVAVMNMFHGKRDPSPRTNIIIYTKLNLEWGQ